MDTKSVDQRMEPGNILRLVYADVDQHKEAEFNRWYNTEHEVLLNEVEGVIRNYKGLNLSNEGQKYFYLYVHKSNNVQNTPQYRAVSQTKWSKEIRPFVQNFHVGNYESMLAGEIPTNLKTGNIIRTLEFNVRQEDEKEFNNWLNKVYLEHVNNVPGLIAFWHAVSLDKVGQKYLSVYFLENADPIELMDYDVALRIRQIKPIDSGPIDLARKNFEVQV
jgi:hypothetical protein